MKQNNRESREAAAMKQLLMPYREQALRQIDAYNRISHKYSARFLARKERILWHGASSGLKTRIILAAMILIVLVCAACVAPSLTERYSNLAWAESAERVNLRDYDAVLEGDYPPGLPSVLPSGYRIVEERIGFNSASESRNNGEMKSMVYYNGQDFLYLNRWENRDEIYLELHSNRYTLETVAGEKQKYVLQRYTDGRNDMAIAWKTGDYCYTVLGKLTESELLKMAESLTEEVCPFLVPAYIPDGFSESACNYGESWQYFTYTDGDERQILFARRNYQTEWGAYPFDDIAAEIGEYESGNVTVNGAEGTWMQAWIYTYGMTYRHIRWQEGGWWYEIGGEAELDELLAMAESIAPTRYRKAADYPEKN